jgi:hypothetical protein
MVLLSIIYVVVRWLLGALAVIVRGELARDVELLVLRHENAVLRRQVGSVRRTSMDPVVVGCAVSATSVSALGKGVRGDPSDAAGVASHTRGPQVGLLCPAQARAPTAGGGDRTVGGPDGQREPELGPSAYPG